MRIACPKCGATYDVPERMLAGRKVVRCSRCGTEWTPGLSKQPALPPETPPPESPHLDLTRVAEAAESPDPAASSQEPAPAPAARPARDKPARDKLEPSAMERLAQAAQPPPRSVWPKIAWLISLLIIFALLGAGYVWRNDIMRAWPPSTRLYAALGLTTPPK